MKIVIVPTTRARKKLLEKKGPFEINADDFMNGDKDALERYGQTWAKFWKTDIVMLVEGEII